jgi:methionine aminotransferase
MLLTSKLPHVGTTIFTVMTQLAQELGAINLAQGFPDYPPPESLRRILAEHALHGEHQYAPMAGLPALRGQIAARFTDRYNVTIDPGDEVTITLGATEALFSAILAFVHPGDEVILIDPAYDAYAPAVLLAGGRPVHVPLAPPAFEFDCTRIASAVTSRTRLFIVNSPHNPTGNVLSPADIAELERILQTTDALLLADEVYECMTFDGHEHVSLVARPALRKRTMSVFSFGKPLHATGWRVGYAIAAPALTQELRRVHQFNTFTIATPLQAALAQFMSECSTHFDTLGLEYQARRDRFNDGLRDTPLRVVPSAGTYFQTLDFAPVSQLSDVELADRLIREAGVASIPVSPFHAAKPHTQVLRFCFAKRDETLDGATARLRDWLQRVI